MTNPISPSNSKNTLFVSYQFTHLTIRSTHTFNNTVAKYSRGQEHPDVEDKMLTFHNVHLPREGVKIKC